MARRRVPVNGSLRPRDAITADMALGSVGLQWDDLYALNVTSDGQYKATRRQGPPKTVTAPTPGELSRALLDDWRSW
jgi:hypothetical protein